MDLTVDEKLNFSFYTEGLPHWVVNEADGSSLSFNSIMADQNGDNHGYMILRLLSDKFTSGKLVRIKVT